MNVKTIIKDNRLSVERFFPSPKELVFEAWSSPEHLSKWWGPNGFTITTHNMDFSDGGIWSFIMHGPDGTDYKNKIQFIKIDKPNLIQYKQSGEEETEDIKFQTKVIFEEVSDGTILKMEMEFATSEELQRVAREFGAIEGAEQHLNRLGEYIELFKKEKI